ncbi:histamine H3 receptor-like [Lissotriton helveticus]
MSLCIAVTAVSNALVMLCFLVDQSLRIQSNYFLLNLSICDFFIGTVSLPIYMVNYVMNGKWILGRTACKLWLAMDYVFSQSSLYSIVLVSYDRFLAVTRAALYRAEQNRTKPAIIRMVAVWSLAFLLYVPTITCWEHIAGYTNVPDGECNPEFFYVRYYRLGTVAVDVFIPFAAIVYFDLSIYCNIRARTRNKAQHAAAACANSSYTNTETKSNITQAEKDPYTYGSAPVLPEYDTRSIMSLAVLPPYQVPRRPRSRQSSALSIKMHADLTSDLLNGVCPASDVEDCNVGNAYSVAIRARASANRLEQFANSGRPLLYALSKAP